VDLGCGNAYLTFGAYAYLSDVLGLEVELVGVDVREQARARNDELASRLGWTEHVRFVAGEIGDPSVLADAAPDVVLALHACDTATDDALVRAVRWRAPVILAAPCCHHDLQRRLAAAATPRPYGLVMRHGLLRERFADVLTDAFRAALLRLLGYRVDVIEFVDSAHTPRNALLRAVLTDAPPTRELAQDYLDLTRAWGVTPYLADVLADELRPVLAGS